MIAIDKIVELVSRKYSDITYEFAEDDLTATFYIGTNRGKIPVILPVIWIEVYGCHETAQKIVDIYEDTEETVLCELRHMQEQAVRENIKSVNIQAYGRHEPCI